MSNNIKSLTSHTPAVAPTALNMQWDQITHALQAKVGPQGITFDHLAIVNNSDDLSGGSQDSSITGVIIGWKDTRELHRPSGSVKFSSADNLIGEAGPAGIRLHYPHPDCGTGENRHHKACNVTRSLLVLRGDSLMPQVLRVPPASFKQHWDFNLDLLTSGSPYCGTLVKFRFHRPNDATGTEDTEISFHAVRRLATAEVVIAKTYADVFGELTVPGGVVNDSWIRETPPETKAFQNDLREHCKQGGDVSPEPNEMPPADRDCIIEALRIDSEWHRINPKMGATTRRPWPGEFWPLDSDDIKSVTVTFHKRRGVEKKPIV